MSGVTAAGAAAVIAATAAVAGAGATIYNGQQQQKEMKKANAAAKLASDKQLALASEELNKKDAKSPDIAARQAGNQSGDNATGTLLTGSGGVDPSKLLLGKNTLLGM